MGFGVGMKISIFYYVLALATAQWLTISQHQPLVFSLGLTLWLCSIWSANDLMDIAHFVETAGSF
ncbi:spore germination protein KB [Geobacillus thermodenitrificans]|uniref:hypothetical protein n=1 Tax=Geobacillus thermodenitrificans TaxID=33940 RepID=UPI00017E361D|nr:hypothetical protein [Geobacillus thermodenitrificans]MEC5187617.1 spore germination protein KB [Geobacillus thermodenitrificans]